MAVGEQRGAGGAVLEEKTVTVEEDEGGGGGKREGDAAPPAAENRDCVVVDVAGSADGGNDRDAETACRICQLRPDQGEEVSLQVLLGCWCNDGEERGLWVDPEVARSPEEAAVVVVMEETATVERGAACAAGSADGAADGSDWDTAMACRICHLSPDRSEEGSELFQLGCGCKGDLGVAHRHCAEAWFKVKGNRYCEICGENAKNVTGEDNSKFMNEWSERGDSSNQNVSERCSCWRHQPFCNFLMACLVIAFMLPWFLRVNMF
ncbi:hypothetical protein OPV22_008275 [Ensete ventricosum]|uniref:RING-CH-type domain-containing protein n=1 Tax=Ensete ventricosum TaxID=4639 RepID=A0AAV8R2J3_ENSVE|nr:hypothetical protein OPV22_008275 [Ensete ventricosum]